MRCNICDRALSDAEIIFNSDIGTFEPCSTCLEIALEAAYSEGFSPDGQQDDCPDGLDPIVEPIDPAFEADSAHFPTFPVFNYFGEFDDD